MNAPRGPAIALGALVCVMVAVYARAFAPHHAAPPHLAMVAASVAAAIPAPGQAVASGGRVAADHRAAQRAASQQVAWGRDPFLRGRTTDATSDLTLSGILWDANQPMAIINGQTLHVGDHLEGYRVTEITQDRVSVSDGTQILQLLVAP